MRNRRTFLKTGAAVAGAWATSRLLAACGGTAARSPLDSPFGRGVYPVGATDRVRLGDPAGRYFYYAIVSDTHIVDDVYFAADGVEGNALDTETMAYTAERFTAARDFLNGLAPALDMVFLPGDFIHNYPTVELGYDNPEDMAYYMNNRTRLDVAKDITDGFNVPVFIGYGNHDYDVGRISHAFTEDLFFEKLRLPRYYAVEHKGVKFIHLNNFLGATQTPGADEYNTLIGSFGETQLVWLEAELQAGTPVVVFLHYAPGFGIIAEREVADLDLLVLLKRYEENILYVISGHTHIWANFGRNFGPPHQVVASTRYDQNAYAIVEVDTETWQHTFLNADLWQHFGHYAEAYDPEALFARVKRG